MLIQVKAQSESNEKQGVGKTIYKHLMNGVSNMLPLVIAGGILMAIVFLFGANSFDPKVQITMRSQNNCGI